MYNSSSSNYTYSSAAEEPQSHSSLISSHTHSSSLSHHSHSSASPLPSSSCACTSCTFDHSTYTPSFTSSCLSPPSSAFDIQHHRLTQSIYQQLGNFKQTTSHPSPSVHSVSLSDSTHSTHRSIHSTFNSPPTVDSSFNPYPSPSPPQLSTIPSLSSAEFQLLTQLLKPSYLPTSSDHTLDQVDSSHNNTQYQSTATTSIATQHSLQSNTNTVRAPPIASSTSSSSSSYPPVFSMPHFNKSPPAKTIRSSYTASPTVPVTLQVKRHTKGPLPGAAAHLRQEVEALKKRLQEIKEKNQEEKKLVSKLTFKQSSILLTVLFMYMC
jgi:hypothetical protein